MGRMVIVSTCHRLELYTEMEGSGREVEARLVGWLAARRHVGADDIRAAATFLEGPAAARHLFRVAAGLDSALLGEAEILAQVRTAISTSIAAHAVTPALKAVFRGAVQTAERARARVWRRFGRADIGSIAAEAAAAALGRAGGRYLVLGAGRVGALAVRALRERAAEVTVVNRTEARAQDLAERLHVQWARIEERDTLIDGADAIIVATGSPGIVLCAHAIARRAADGTRPLAVIDLSMPRNSDPAIDALLGERSIDLARLDERVARAHAERATGIPEVEALIEAELDAVVHRHPRPLPAHSPCRAGAGCASASS